jgi:hypothetical protein
MFNRNVVRNSQLEEKIQLIKLRVRSAVNNFAGDLEQGNLFSPGTCENIINDRYAEMDEFFKKLDKIKRTIPPKLSKQIRLFKQALPIANQMKNALQPYASADVTLSQFDNVPMTDEVRQQFKRAFREAMKHYYAAARHLLLQKKLSLYTDEMKCISNRVQHLHDYAKDPANINTLTPILNDLSDIESSQRKEHHKAIAGLMLRVIGWSIMIFATAIALNPAVGWLVLGISIGLTIVGELINITGKKLREPSILQKETVGLHNALRLFKTKPIPVLNLEPTQLDSPLLVLGRA